MASNEELERKKRQARAAGYTEEEIQEAEREYRQRTGLKKGNFATNTLGPIAAGALGSVGGFLLGGPAGAVAGGAAASGAYEALRQRILNEDPNFKKIAIESALGAIPAAAGKTSQVGKRIVGNVLKESGEKAAIKGIRPTPTQLINFSKRHGEDISQVLRRHKLEGYSADEIAERAITPLQESFDKIAKNTNVSVNIRDLDKNFYKRISALLQSTDKDDHALAEKLLKQYDSIASEFKKKPFSLARLTQERKLFDEKVKNFAINPRIAGEKRLIADILRETIQDTAERAGLRAPNGQSLKEIGIELSKLYNLHDIAAMGAQKGRGNLPVGLLQLLGVAGGGIVGGPTGSVATVAGTLLANNPKLIGIYSRLAKSVSSSMLKESATPSTAKMLAGQAIGQGLTRSIIKSPSVANEQLPLPTAIAGPAQDQATEPSMPAQKSFDEQWLQEALIKDYILTGGKNADFFKQIAELSGVGSKAKPMTSTQAQASGYAARIQEANRIIDQYEPLAVSLGASIKRKLPNFMKGEAAQVIDQAERNFVNAVLRRESGAAISASEFENARKQYLPQPGDSPAVLENKRRNRELVLQALINEATAAPPQPFSPQDLLMRRGVY
jgi:hypothetical protein